MEAKYSLFVYTPGNIYEFAGPEDWCRGIWDALDKVTTPDEKGVTPMFVTFGDKMKARFRVPAITGWAMRPYQPSYAKTATDALKDITKAHKDALGGGDEWRNG